jgi:hypothetical protein
MAIDNQYDGKVVDRATNFQKDGDRCVRQVKSPRGGSQPKYAPSIWPRASLPRHRPRSRPNSPTDKLKTYREARYGGKYREVCREVDQDSTEAVYRERNHEVAGLSPKRTSTDDYRIKLNLPVNAIYR